MFLSRLFGRRPAGRNLFTFHDGSAERSADPLYLWRTLEEAAGEDPADLLRTIATDVPPPVPGVDTSALEKSLREKQRAAVKTLASAACSAFGVKPLKDGSRKGGLTELELVSLASRLAAYLGGLADQARPFTSSPSPTATSPPG